MKSLQFILIGLLILSLNSCSDLLGTEELQAELEKQEESIITSNCGAGSINESNPPAVILDGKLIDHEEIDSINPDSISNITVIKDAEGWKKHDLPQDTPGVIAIEMK